jgi:TetR/AcrR family transcriptional repressor of nem operon
MKKHDVYQQILEVAENFTQTKGYNAFSYRDIAEQVGVKTSSIHYYFPTKADLGQAVVKKHIEALCDELEQLILTKNFSCQKKLELFIDGIVTKTYLSNQKMCLGGMLASDVLTLPDIIQKEVRVFFNRLEDWLKRLLLEACNKKEFCLEKKAIASETQLILSLLEGSLLLARLFQDEKYLTSTRRNILERLIRV